MSSSKSHIRCETTDDEDVIFLSVHFWSICASKWHLQWRGKLPRRSRWSLRFHDRHKKWLTDKIELLLLIRSRISEDNFLLLLLLLLLLSDHDERKIREFPLRSSSAIRSITHLSLLLPDVPSVVLFVNDDDDDSIMPSHVCDMSNRLVDQHCFEHQWQSASAPYRRVL